MCWVVRSLMSAGCPPCEISLGVKFFADINLEYNQTTWTVEAWNMSPNTKRSHGFVKEGGKWKNSIIVRTKHPQWRRQFLLINSRQASQSQDCFIKHNSQHKQKEQKGIKMCMRCLNEEEVALGPCDKQQQTPQGLDCLNSLALKGYFSKLIWPWNKKLNVCEWRNITFSLHSDCDF